MDSDGYDTRQRSYTVPCKPLKDRSTMSVYSLKSYRQFYVCMISRFHAAFGVRHQALCCIQKVPALKYRAPAIHTGVMTACCLLTRVNLKNASAVCRRPNFPEYGGTNNEDGGGKQLKFIHVARGLLVVTRTIASYRAHLIVRFAVLASFICRVLRGKSCYVFCSRTDD